MPAIAFNRLQADPTLIYAAPDDTATVDVTLTNIGNIAGNFPLSVTLPQATWSLVTTPTTPVLLNASQADSQSIAVAVPAAALLGHTFPLQVDSPTPNTPYIQTVIATVQIVSANALPIYQAGQAAAELYPDDIALRSALDFLAQAIDDLEQSCQQGECDLVLRNRVVSGLHALAQVVEPISPLLTVHEAIDDLSDLVASHTNGSDLITDNATARDLVAQLMTQLTAVSHHTLQTRFTPGLHTVLENRATTFDLALTNKGSLTTTAILTLTPPPQCHRLLGQPIPYPSCRATSYRHHHRHPHRPGQFPGRGRYLRPRNKVLYGTKP